MKKRVWNIIIALCFAVLLGAAVFLVMEALSLGMLPERYLFALIGVCALAVLVLGFFMLPRLRHPRKLPGRMIAAALALVMAGGCLYGAMAVRKVRSTVDEVTGGPEYSAMIDVYVLKDSPAQSLEDAADMVFAYTEVLDKENMHKALEEIRSVLGEGVQVREFRAIPDMADALYQGEVDAMILNSAYLGILEELPTYGEFSQRTRILYSYGVAAEQEQTAATGNPELPDAPGVAEPFLMYLSGSDTRSKILDQARSDVNILAAVNPETHQILLVNTPRDYYVVHPMSKHGTRDKLAHCGVYGLECSITAMTELYGIRPDYYSQINFTGFETLIDAVGGITVYSEKAFTSRIGGYYFAQGENHLDGRHALCFARERYAFADGDNQRGKNQMKVIQAVIEKVSSASTIVSSYGQILDSMQDMFVTSMPRETIAELVKLQLSDMPAWEVFTYAVTGTGDMQPTYSAPNMKLSVTWPDEKQLQHGHDLITRVLDGERLTQADVAK